MKLYHYLVMLFFFSLAACHKEIAGPASAQAVTTWDQAFEQFWNELDVNYVYWDIDTTNWDAVHSRYKTLFGRLQWGDPADMQRSVAYFRQMTDGLIDHHFSISFKDTVLKDSAVNPAIDQLRELPDFRYPLSYISLDRRYLDPGFLYGNDITTEPGSPLKVLAGTIHGNILFFTCNQFNLAASFQSSIPNNVQPVLNYFFDRLQHPSGLKAILLDLRDNPGGAVADLNFLVGRFIGQRMVFGHTRYKSGNGRLDHTPWIEASVSPAGGAQGLSLPVYVLADRYSASVAELVIMALRQMSQCRVIGEATYGATGPFVENGLYNDGPFDIPGLLSVHTSSAEFRYLDGKCYEGKGFPPDEAVPFSLAATGSGDDPQMEKALSMAE